MNWRVVIQKLKCADWLTFAIVTIVIFLKNILFHYSCFGYLAFSSLWTAPVDFFAFYFAKLSPAVFIASFCFITRRKWWLVPVCLLLDLWLVADLIYFRANGFFLDIDTIAMAGNMDGFWSSVGAYINWSVYVIVATSILLFVYLVFVFKKKIADNTNNSWLGFAIGMSVVIVLGLFNWFCGYKNTKETSLGQDDGWKYNCITAVQNVESGNFQMFNWCVSQWVEAQSPMHFFPALAYSGIYRAYYHSNNDVELSESDKQKVTRFIRPQKPIAPSDNLIVIIGESFESWVVGLCDDIGENVAPNMTKYAYMDNTMYCSKIKCQVRSGSSGDGQMIINTGLLPISTGAACMTYGDNIYPNIAEKYIYSCVVNPCSDVWNQKQITEKYGYRNLLQMNTGSWQSGDSLAFTMAHEIVDSCLQPFSMQIITVTTHSPFDCGGRVNMHFPEEMPDNLRNYLNCMHYADSCIGVFLSRLERDSLLDNTTVVITGDHTIFKKSLLSEYQQFAQKYNYPIPAEESYCPLLILSPRIKENMKIDELCYQMDIYPTIINLVGEEGYSWKGFGVNLLDSVARHNRPITEQEAYILSDKIIRSNYFAEIKK